MLDLFIYAGNVFSDPSHVTNLTGMTEKDTNKPNA
jgi:hypothetical protein